jgi:hypothetical protein
MNARRGLFRAWIVISILWIIGAGIVGYETIGRCYRTCLLARWLRYAFATALLCAARASVDGRLITLDQ